MNVFILGTGRCGSVSMIRACRHITNYSSGHESRASLSGPERFAYPENHIEADNRLSWLLGGLDSVYGDEAVYVHLKRDREKTARSFLRRFASRRSMIHAYTEGIKMTVPETLDKDQRLAYCRDFVETVYKNVDAFLKGKSRTMELQLENIDEDFMKFWTLIGAEGDPGEALKEFSVKHNASGSPGLNLKSLVYYPILRIYRRLTIKFD